MSPRAAIILVGILPFVVSHSASALEPPSRFVSGQALAANGQPLVGAKVEAALVVQPAGGGTITPVVFAETVSDAAGRYTLTGLPPGLGRGSGAAEVQITVSDGDQAVHRVIEATPPAITTADWSSADGEPIGDLSLQMQAGMVNADSTFVGDPVETAVVAEPDDVAPTPAAAGASACADTYQAVWVPQYGSTTRRLVPLQRLRTRNHSRQLYEYETTKNTKMEVAFTGDGGNYAGGLTSSTSQETELGLKMGRILNNKSRLLRIEWEYLKYRKKCVGVAGQYYWLNVYQWRPNVRTSGSNVIDNELSWTCDGSTTVTMAVETWVAKSSSVVWSGWFGIGGVKLDAKQTNSDKHKLTIYPDSGERDPRICGDNGYPSVASRIKERVD